MDNTNATRYTPRQYSRFWWGVIDNTVGLYVFLDENKNPKTLGPDTLHDGHKYKHLLFKNKQECCAWCLKNNYNEDGIK